MAFTYIPTKYDSKRFRLERLPVFFTPEESVGVIEKVLWEDAKFRNFPGIAEDERWAEKLRIGLAKDVRFEAQFHGLKSGEYLMLWLIQPNGWYWVDEDGFGFTGDSSIMLYSLLDADGNFKQEFQLFSIDDTHYCHDFDQYV